MRYRYSKWTPESQTDEQRLQSLMSLFSYLVVKTSGDVEEALEWLRQIGEKYGIIDESLTMEELIEKLKEMGIIEEVKGINNLTTKGVQKVRQDALKQIFSSLKKAPGGNHDVPDSGSGIDRLGETKKFSFGDMPTNIDLTSTLTNAFIRDGLDNFALKEEDLEVYETEHQTSCATVLMLDISHSMILYGEDRITPAKQVALALAEMIRIKFPKDYLALVVFGDEAKLLSINVIPFLQVGPYHHPLRTSAGPQSAAEARECEQADFHGDGWEALRNF
jgi:Ca-activated chloride channel family protein